MSQVTVAGRTFLIVRYAHERDFTISEMCTKPEAGCKRGRHYHMVSRARTKDEARALINEAYGDKQVAP